MVLTISLACIINTSGITVISRYEKWGIDNAVYFMSFAAGVLAAIGVLHEFKVFALIHGCWYSGGAHYCTFEKIVRICARRSIRTHDLSPFRRLKTS